MGEVVKLGCPKCGYTEKLMLGNGMLDFNINHVLQNIDKQTFALVNEWMKLNKLVWHKSKRVLAYCGECKGYKSTVIIELIAETEKKDVFIANCQQCGNKPQIVDSSKTNCPECGSSLVFEDAGLWD